MGSEHDKIVVKFKKKDGSYVQFKVKRRHRARKSSMTLPQIKRALGKEYRKKHPVAARKIQKILRRSPGITIEQAMKRYARMGYKAAKTETISVV